MKTKLNDYIIKIEFKGRKSLTKYKLSFNL